MISTDSMNYSFARARNTTFPPSKNDGAHWDDEAHHFRTAMYAVVMPILSLVGLLGNSASIYVLQQCGVKVKKIFVDLLTALAVFDNLFLITNFFLLTLPNWTDIYPVRWHPGE